MASSPEDRFVNKNTSYFNVIDLFLCKIHNIDHRTSVDQTKAYSYDGIVKVRCIEQTANTQHYKNYEHILKQNCLKC